MPCSDNNGQLNLDWAITLIDGLVAAGVREIVISPGARSSPLTLASLRHPGLHCKVVVDERSAAWFALGRVRADRAPVALVCTSGTAAANWLPAVVEANHAALPLMLLSADRPPELQGWGANQAIDQTQLFAGQIRSFHAPGVPFPGFERRWLRQLAIRAVSEAIGPLPGPVHLNLPFRDPLLPAEPHVEIPAATSLPVDVAPARLLLDTQAVQRLASALSGRRGVIVCGGGLRDQGFPDAVTALAEALACPILADPHSGLRFGAHAKHTLCVAHERWLCDESQRQAHTCHPPDWILRFGDLPVTRCLQDYLDTCPDHYLIEAHGRWPDPQHRTRQLLRGQPVEVCRALLATGLSEATPLWLHGFRQAEMHAEAAAVPPPEGLLFRELCRLLPSGSRLFCGPSMPIRDLAAWSGIGDRTIDIHANRGASGIDGNIATAAGLADAGPTIAIVGDLTAQHDLGSMVLMRHRPLVVVVINNGGGGIFEFLPSSGLPEFEAGWLTPQALDFARAAAAFGIAHRMTSLPLEACDLATTALSAGKPMLVELQVDRKESWRHRQNRR